METTGNFNLFISCICISLQRVLITILLFQISVKNTFDEFAILNTLPTKSCTDISLDLHLELLNQVELFHCVERPVICELVSFFGVFLFVSKII